VDTIPGCESLDYIDEGEYTGKIRLGLAGISGSYILTVESDPPRYCRYEGEVNGKSGLICWEAKIYLSEDDDWCLIDYQANGIITGAFSHFNPHFIESIAQTLIKHGLIKMDRNCLTTLNLSSGLMIMMPD
jgi:carbon monoxide dehydrogenase subunit G